MTAHQKTDYICKLTSAAHLRAAKRLGIDLKHIAFVLTETDIVSKIRNSTSLLKTVRLASGKYQHVVC
jgi:hypothetical protein